MSLMQNEIKKKVLKLKKLVERAESKGNFKSAHHQMLENYERMLKKPVEGVTPRNAKSGDKEK